MSRPITPIFLFSLPRSGSTLLQRIIAAHPRISTASEPWLLLPIVYALREEGTYAEYDHWSMRNALEEFIAALPGTRAAYRKLINQFATGLYSEFAKDGDRYFLDKTPRYHLIVNEIIEIFPDAKFIFLWRNPVAIVGSAFETFGEGKWRLDDFRIDFFKGFESLHAAFQKHGNKAHTLNFERLLGTPEQELRRLFDYLELNSEIPDINSFTQVKLAGGAGDPTGTKRYEKVSTEPLHKWKTSLCNPIRLRWTRRWINWIGENRLADIGYSHSELIREMDSVPASYRRVYSDAIRIIYGFVSTLLETQILADKFRKLPSWSDIYPHK